MQRSWLMGAVLPLTLLACSPSADQRSTAANATEDVTASVVAAEPAVSPASPDPQVRYSCENGAAVLVRYVNATDGSERAQVEMGGKSYNLPIAVSASGARYTSDQGRTPGRSLTWWTKGNDAMLIDAPVGSKDGEGDEIVNCQEAGE